MAVSMVKDEADVIETCVRHMAAHVDHVIVADNGSTDGTREILDHLPCEVIDDPDPAYYQSRKMTALAMYALDGYSAKWVVPFDADEIWCPTTAPTLSEQLRDTDTMIAAATLYDHVVTDADAAGVAPQQSMTHRLRQPGALPKVAARPLPGMVIEMGNHAVTYPSGHPATAATVLTVHHFPVRSPEQHLRKARQGAQALALTDLDPSVGAHWRDWGKLIDRVGDTVFADVFLDHWFYRSGDDRLVVDPAPVAS